MRCGTPSFALAALGLACAVAAAPGGARAETLWARETAFVRPQGAWEVGLFNPLAYALTDHLTVETHPLLNLVGGFNVALRLARETGHRWALALEGAASLPTPALRLTQHLPVASPFFPRWSMSERAVGWVVVPRLGAIWSYGAPRGAVATLRADVAVGVPLGPNDAYPVDSLFAPLELLLAPALTGFRGRIGAGYDHPVVDWLRLRAQAFVYAVGPHPSGRAQLDPFVIEGYAGVDARLAAGLRVTVGAKWYNWDQGATRVEVDRDGWARRVRVRSNDFWPTFDLIWEG